MKFLKDKYLHDTLWNLIAKGAIGFILLYVGYEFLALLVRTVDVWADGFRKLALTNQLDL